jgi:hypothetical protein
MIACSILSFLSAYLLIKELVKDENHPAEVLLAMGTGVFIMLGLSGALGVIAKTFELWGNSW